MSKSALEYFCGVPRMYNCAQAVAAGAGALDRVSGFAQAGGGRAPGGMCGALYAALSLIPEDGKKKEAEAEFLKEAGFVCCRDLKAAGVPCTRCVELASRLLTK